MSKPGNRIDRRFETLKREGRTALIPYVTAGHPDPDVTVPLMHALVEGGADLIELGIPFSDPMADGPVIQRACEVALEKGVTLESVLTMVASFRERDTDTPVILMGYLNPVHVMGTEAFAVRAAQAGVDGVLLVDLPPEEGTELSAALSANGLCQICLLAPTTSEKRMRWIDGRASGFLYYVALTGVTGANTFDPADVAKHVNSIRAASKLPVAVGFGIKDAASAAAVAKCAEAVVVGSALVARIHEEQTAEGTTRVAGDLMRELRAGVDSVAGAARQGAL